MSVHAVLTNLVSGIPCDVLTRYVMRLGARLCHRIQTTKTVVLQFQRILLVLAYYQPKSVLINDFVQLDKKMKIPFSKQPSNIAVASIINLLNVAQQDPINKPEPHNVSSAITVEKLIDRNSQQMTGQQQSDVRNYVLSIHVNDTGKDWLKYSQQNVASTILQVQVENNFIRQFLNANVVADT